MVGIICACLPMAKVFFTRLAPQWLGMTVASTRNAPTPRLPTVGGWTGTTVSETSSKKLSKRPQRASVMISTIRQEEERERGDFVPLVDVDSRKSQGNYIGVAK